MGQCSLIFEQDFEEESMEIGGREINWQPEIITGTPIIPHEHKRINHSLGGPKQSTSSEFVSFRPGCFRHEPRIAELMLGVSPVAMHDQRAGSLQGTFIEI